MKKTKQRSSAGKKGFPKVHISKGDVHLEKEQKAVKGKRMTPIKELQMRNMRLTQEFDRLSTEVAAQGNLLYRIHQMLMTEKMMPFETGRPLDPVTQKPKDYNLVTPGMKAAAIFSAGKGEVRYFNVRIKNQETTIGYLTNEGKITLDPKDIGKFNSREDAQRAITHAELPAGAKHHLESFR